MSDIAFQSNVIESLSELKTKMNILVGEDGTGGWKHDTDERLAAAERARWKASGLVSAIVSAVVSALLGHWRHA